MTNLTELVKIQRELIEFKISAFNKMLPILENWQYKNGKPKKVTQALITALNKAIPEAVFLLDNIVFTTIKIQASSELVSKWNTSIKEVLPDFEKLYYLNTSYCSSCDTELRLYISKTNDMYIDIEYIKEDFKKWGLQEKLQNLCIGSPHEFVLTLFREKKEIEENIKKLEAEIYKKQQALRAFLPFGLEENIEKRLTAKVLWRV